MTPTPEVVTIGRIGVDVYPQQVGVGLEEVESFGKFLGGSPTNVAVAASRLGHSAAVVTRVGDDPFGAFTRSSLRGFGVDDAWVSTDPKLPTPVTFCEIFPPDDFPLYFYRHPIAPDLMITPDDVPTDAVAAAAVYWATLTGLAAEPSRAAHVTAWDARDRARHTIIDLDYRPMFWDDPEEATRQAAVALDASTVAVGNREECTIAVGESDPQRAADALLDRGVELAVVKQGPRGTLAATADERVVVPPVPVQVVNGLGAGDAFGGALCHGLIEGWDLSRVIRFANAAGAYVAARLECSSAMPTRDQVDALIASTPQAGQQA